MFGLAGSQPQKGQGQEPKEQNNLSVFFCFVSYLQKLMVGDRGLRYQLLQQRVLGVGGGLEGGGGGGVQGDSV